MSDAAANLDPRVDAYIAKSAAFARPILVYLRELVHEACPSVQENIKWGMPSFEYNGMLCSMAAFKQHVSFGFWKHELVVGPQGAAANTKRVNKAGAAKKASSSAAKTDAPAVSKGKSGNGMGEFGKVAQIADLPPRKKLIEYVRRAVRLNDEGVKAPRVVKKARPPAKVPDDLAAALRRNKTAATNFAAMSPSHQREYIEWIVEAKRPETREKRLATTIEWVGEGKARNWKYERC
ncbi:MAG: YdeI/OmpD-associated family protein [Phycisphaerae bacterium]